jgi:hypothetical protein
MSDGPRIDLLQELHPSVHQSVDQADWFGEKERGDDII